MKLYKRDVEKRCIELMAKHPDCKVEYRIVEYIDMCRNITRRKGIEYIITGKNIHLTTDFQGLWSEFELVDGFRNCKKRVDFRAELDYIKRQNKK